MNENKIQNYSSCSAIQVNTRRSMHLNESDKVKVVVKQFSLATTTVPFHVQYFSGHLVSKINHKV